MPEEGPDRRIAPWVAESLATLPRDPRAAGLQALALRLAVDLDAATDPRDVAQLSGQLRAVLADLRLVPEEAPRAAGSGAEGGVSSGSLGYLRARTLTRVHRAATVDPPAS